MGVGLNGGVGVNGGADPVDDEKQQGFLGTRRFLMPPVDSESTVKRMVRNKAETMETVSSRIP